MLNEYINDLILEYEDMTDEQATITERNKIMFDFFKRFYNLSQACNVELDLILSDIGLVFELDQYLKNNQFDSAVELLNSKKGGI